MSSSGDSPGAISEMLGLVAYAFAEVQPYLPMYTHLILSALFPIFTGAYSSLSRPSSAAKPPRKPKGRRGADDEDDDESSIQKMEGLSPSDAIIFPLLAGCTLGGLYLLIKYMGAVLLNKILRWYFSAMAIFSVAKLINDGMGVMESFCFPQYYVDKAVLWQVNNTEEKAIHSASLSRPSPLPGVLGRILLPQHGLRALWFLRKVLGQKYCLRLHLSKLIAFKVKLNLRSILSTCIALGVVFSSNFVTNVWWLTNLQGFAFSYSALQLMSPTTFGTGSLVLAALFFYDIYFVFYTPLMVTVATKLDVPIKLLFPRPLEEGQDPSLRKLAMLGLGDIVIPGMMIGLALRFDLYMFYLRKQKKGTSVVSPEPDTDKDEDAKEGQAVQKEVYRSVTGQWGNKFWTSSWIGRSFLPKDTPSMQVVREHNPIPTFPKPYFYASVLGYVLGMCTTLGIMQVFKHAQPALLYLVPGVLSSLWLTAAIRGEIKQMWGFSEASDDEEEHDAEKERNAKEESSKKEDEKKAPTPSSWWGESFFSTAKTERNAERLEKQLSQNFSTEDKDKKGETGFFHFSLTRDVPQKSTSESPGLSADKKRFSSLGSDEAVLITDADLIGAEPRWRGLGSGTEAKEERAGKRRRI